jgi:hypothetical protein
VGEKIPECVHAGVGIVTRFVAMAAAGIESCPGTHHHPAHLPKLVNHQ